MAPNPINPWGFDWVYQDCTNSPPVLGNFWAVFPGHREGARVVPHPAPCELSSRHKPGSFGAKFGAVLEAALGPARQAGSSSRGPKPDIDCYYNPEIRPNSMGSYFADTGNDDTGGKVRLLPRALGTAQHLGTASGDVNTRMPTGTLTIYTVWGDPWPQTL